ncbi:MAG: AAA family ATPase [Mycobacterium sp.]|uniref:helix-turn-helix transcriptional regulator n=1 Tax=Mycobacterium sp. TaxID=1785 RepID=UPI00389A95C9
MDLIDRDAERDALDRFVASVRAGESQALVLSGEAGVGKTALLDYLAANAPGCRIARTTGCQSEMELAFAALHQLCGPMLDGLQRLPPPQRDAVRTAFGMSTGPVPDRFLVGLGVLGLLSEITEEQPLVCLVDDEQWLDRASAQVLGFVARRLAAESVGMVFAARVPSSELAGLEELRIAGLQEPDAQALLDSVLTGPLDPRVRDQILAETHGNPLALLEFPRGLISQQLAGRSRVPGALRLSDGIEDNFRRRVEILPEQTRRLLLIAAAQPIGDPVLVWRASARLGIDPEAAAPAVEDGLVEFGTRVQFRHPLVRSVVYGSALPQDRRQVHRVLAEVTDPERDPDRHAWHRAHAAPGPDEDVAAELERCAGRAQARGGVAAEAAFLERAAILTLDPARRIDRALGAASAKIKAGAFAEASELLSIAEAGLPDDFQQARIELVRAELSFVTIRGSDSPSLLLKAATRLTPIDIELSRATYLLAFSAAILAGRLALGGGVLEVARAARDALPPRHATRASDLLLEGLAAHFDAGYEAGLPILRKAMDVFGVGMSVDEQLRCYWIAGVVASHLWDDDRWYLLSQQHVQLVRGVGALSELPLALGLLAATMLFAGDLAGAASVAVEHQAAVDATGIHISSPAELGLMAFRGRQTDAAPLIDATITEANVRGEGIGIALAEWANAVLNNGLGSYETAMLAAQRATAYPVEMVIPSWAAVELVEAAARSGHDEVAAEALRRLAERTTPSGTDWALGVEARSRALLSDGDTAERLHLESIERLGRTRMRADLARAHLLYGEWLRRQRRRIDARTQLRVAHDMLDSMGMEAFAERARRELQATGEIARKRTVDTGAEQLTAQEAQIARMARDGLSNPEIGVRMFISARTVQYHLRKVFTKLGIESRSQLDRVLPE